MGRHDHPRGARPGQPRQRQAQSVDPADRDDPIYSASVGHVAEIPLTQLCRDEILLTAAQTLLGIVVLARLRFTRTDALILLGLFAAQFASPGLHGPLTVAYVVVALGTWS